MSVKKFVLVPHNLYEALITHKAGVNIDTEGPIDEGRGSDSATRDSNKPIVQTGETQSVHNEAIKGNVNTLPAEIARADSASVTPPTGGGKTERGAVGGRTHAVGGLSKTKKKSLEIRGYTKSKSKINNNKPINWISIFK
jgi:hypothetical protein